MFVKPTETITLYSTRIEGKTRQADASEYFFTISDTPAAENIPDGMKAVYHPGWGDGVYYGEADKLQPYDPHS